MTQISNPDRDALIPELSATRKFSFRVARQPRANTSILRTRAGLKDSAKRNLLIWAAIFFQWNSRFRTDF